jgi:methionyl aminopeptidase
MIIIKSEEEIQGIRESSLILSEVLNIVKDKVAAGVTAKELDELAKKEILERKAEPSFLGYGGYPYALCVSVNEEVVHALPLASKIFKKGDVVSLDLGVNFKGFFSDMALTVGVGEIEPRHQKLIEATRESLYLGIKEAKVGKRIGDIGAVIEAYAQKNGFSVVKSLVGHGVGKAVHEDPPIPNFGKKGNGPVLKEGMVIAIEPMLNLGVSEVELAADNWAYITRDREVSAHFEHTIAILKDGPEILTK